MVLWVELLEPRSSSFSEECVAICLAVVSLARMREEVVLCTRLGGAEFPGGNGQEEESYFNSGCFLYIISVLSVAE